MVTEQKPQKLLQVLKDIPPGPIATDRIAELIEALKRDWHCFDGAYDTDMAEWKLDRIENPEWDPPILKFDIERHGAMCLGSTRAEIQTWEVNLETLEATQYRSGRRQILPTMEPWRKKEARKVAEKIANAILEGREIPELIWREPTRARIELKKAIPDYGRCCNWTRSSRRKRLYEAIDELLEGTDWFRDRFFIKKTDKIGDEDR